MSMDLVTAQLIGDSLVYASEEMGFALRNSAYSPNIKERMDHSAALFDPTGRLLAQAEHIPVHLGSLPWGLKRLIESCAREGPPIEEGVMVASNDPYLTGTHLNDLTLLLPIHHRGELVAFAVNKAHHSDVGGLVPGSISTQAKTLFEEGFVLEPTVVWKETHFVEGALSKFSSASRTPQERLGDIRAQAAANITGSRRVKDLIGRYGLAAFKDAGAHLISHAEAITKKRLSRLKKGTYSAVDYIEGPGGEDLKICARVTVTDRKVAIDYAGTSPQVDYPLNAVFGVTISGAHFAFRCLTGDDIPANHGTFSLLEVSAPAGCLVNPSRPHPVGGGNVETSQRNADVLFRAFSRSAPRLVPAAAGGSMNNVIVGGKHRGKPWTFYETIGVGLGGSRSRDGVDGIQANMTNTMNTPVEEMERSFPFRVLRYELRPDSGGPGRSRGGVGLIRTYMVLSDGTSFTVMADRERHPPWGLAGGKPGGMTEVRLTRGGSTRRIPSKSTHMLDSGDIVEVRTAGGGGFGSPRSRPRQMVEEDLADGLVSRESALRNYPRKPGRRPPSGRRTKSV